MYNIIFYTALVLVKIFFRVEVIGKENLIKNRGFILVSNHLHALDPAFIVLAYGRLKDKVMVLGKKELFANKLACWFFKTTGVVALDRGKADMNAINTVVDKIKGGSGCLVFPEGTRSKDGKLLNFKSGAVVIAQSTQVDVIPSAIIYDGGKLKLFGKVKIVCGKPLSCDELGLNEEKSGAMLKKAKKMIMSSVSELLEANRGDYNS